MKTGIAHTLNPTTDQEKKLYSHRFYTLLQHGYIYDEELNQLYHNSLLSDTDEYILHIRMISPSKR